VKGQFKIKPGYTLAEMGPEFKPGIFSQGGIPIPGIFSKHG